MLMWMRSGAQTPLALPHGIVRARDVQCLNHMHEAQTEVELRAQKRLADAEIQAEACLAKASHEAKELLRSSRADIEAARQQGYDDGMAQATLDWHEQQATLAAEHTQALQSLHQKMATIVTSAVERIVHTDDREGLYQRAMSSVQTLTQEATTLTLRVNPSDETAAKSGVAIAQQGLPNQVIVDVQVDSSLPTDSCIFESPHGVIDASLQTQLKGLRLAMERAVRRAVIEERDPTQPLPPLGAMA